MGAIQIRQAEETDLTAVHQLIQELAEYEKAPDEVTLSVDQLKQDFQEARPAIFILVAETAEEIVGMALYYLTYSTWKGRCLYLEDMIVTKEWRRSGIGELMFDELIIQAANWNAKRMAWQVLEWNQPAIRFYEKYNAYLDPEWVNGKLVYSQLQAAKNQ